MSGIFAGAVHVLAVLAGTAASGDAAPLVDGGVQATPAQAGVITGVTEVKDGRQLEVLCREVNIATPRPKAGQDVIRQRLEKAEAVERRRQALERVYLVRLPSDRFRFQDYDTDTGSLVLDTRTGFHAMRGMLTVWSAETDGLEFPLPPARAQEVALLKGKGRALLWLYVHLDADPDEADEMDSLNSDPCASRAHSGAYQLRVTYLAAVLVDAPTGRHLATAMTEKGRLTPLLAKQMLGEATLRIGAPEGAGDSTGGVLAAMEEKRAGFAQCYARFGNGAEGGVVLGLDLDKAGTVKDVSTVMATLDGDDMGKCLADEARTARLSLRLENPLHVEVPLVWSRPDPE